MNIQLLKVYNKGISNIRICLSGQWLPDMGFIPHALVRVIPEPGGVTLAVCMDSSTQGHGGKVIRVPDTNGWKVKSPELVVAGKCLCETGLHYGEPLIARYSPGLIRIRRFPASAKAVTMTDNQIRLAGSWLAESGFLPDTVALAFPKPGRIVIKRYNTALAIISDYADLVRFARQNKVTILQFCNDKRKFTCANIPSSCVDKAGFAPGDTLIAYYEHNQVVIQRLDLSELGF